MFDGLDNAYPLTPLQQGMLYETLRQSDTDIYIAYIVIDIDGDTERNKLCAAWQQTLAQHEALRTRFVWEGLDEPLQLVNSATDLAWSDCDAPVDASTGHQLADAEALDYWLQHERSTALSLTDRPPQRFRLVTLGGGCKVLIWTVHHMLADDWSTPLVLHSVAAHYQAMHQAAGVSVPSSSPAMPYAAYVEWLRTTDMTAHRDWWQQALRQARPTPLVFERAGVHSDPDIDSLENRHQRLQTRLTEKQTAGVGRLARTLGVTLSSVMHAAWALVVARYAGKSQALFGTSVSGRSCPLPGIDEAVGLFLNTLPTNIMICPELTRDQFISGIQHQLFEQISHEHVPLSELLHFLPLQQQRNPFESVLVIEAHGTDLTIDVPGSHFRFSNIRYLTDSHFPLTVLVFPGTQLCLDLVGPGSTFSREAIAELSQELVAVLDDLCHAKNYGMEQLLGRQSNRIGARYPMTPLRCVPAHERINDWIHAEAQANPDNVAVIDAGVSYSYAQLSSTAVKITQALRARVDDSRYVGIRLHRGFNQIAAILGVLDARRAYVPIDPEWPVARIDMMCSDAQISTLVTDRENRHSGSVDHVSIVLLEEVLGNDCQPPDEATRQNVATPTADTGDAYLIFTSGSTGRPKGVPISHRNLVYSTAARIEFYAEQPECYLLLSSFAFDSSVAGLFWTLCTGGTLVLPGRLQAQDVHAIADLMSRHGVTHTLCLPSIHSLLLRFASSEKLKSLKCVIVAGEPCPSVLPAAHARCLPATSLYNEYGPTEATVWATVANLSNAEPGFENPVPIGQAIPGTQVKVVGPGGQVRCPGTRGELVVFGPGVAQGYLGDEGLSRERFFESSPDALHDKARLPDRTGDGSHGVEQSYRTGDTAVLGFDGQIYYLGRLDSQLKIRGHRLETGEFESRIERHERVHEAVCTVQSVQSSDGLAESVQLTCFYTLNGVSEPDSTECCVINDPALHELMTQIERSGADCISNELPANFRIHRFAAVNRIPRLPNGKIDPSGFPVLHAATDADETSHEFSIDSSNDSSKESDLNRRPASSGVVEHLCRLLAECLRVKSVEPADNFFALGGDSLLAIRFVALCREQGLMLTVPMIATLNSINELAEALAADGVLQQQEQPAQSGVDAFGETPLMPIQQWFFSQTMTCRTHWSMAFNVELLSAFSESWMRDAIGKALLEFPVLGSRFLTDQGISLHIPAQPPSVLINTISDGIPEDAWVQTLADLQDEFSLEAGRLAGCLLAVDENGQCRRVGLVLHHLVTDALSNWQLARCIAQHISGNAAFVHYGGAASFRECSISFNQRLPEPSVTDRINPESGAVAFCEHDVLTHRLPVTRDELLQLRTLCRRTEIDLHEYLLYLILQCVDSDLHFRVDIETHGRDLLDESLAASGSVGWFSSFFTLGTAVASSDEDIPSFRDHFRLCKQQDRLQFSLNPQRYFDSTSTPDNTANNNAEFSLLYNYLAVNAGGEVKGTQEPFHMVPLLDARFRDGTSARAHPIDIVVTDEDDSLQIIWQIDKSLSGRLQVDNWMARCAEKLATLSMTSVDDSVVTRAADNIAVSTHHFPDSGMTSEELDQFLDSLD